MPWGDKSVSPCAFNPDAADAAGMTLDPLVGICGTAIGTAAALVKQIPPVFELYYENYIVGGAGVPDTWPDLSGTTRATQTTDALKPTKTTSGLQFSEGRVLVLSANPSLTSTVLLCMRLDRWTGSQFSYLFGGVDGNYLGYDWDEGGPRISAIGYTGGGYGTNNYRMELWDRRIVVSLRQKPTTPYLEMRMAGVLTAWPTPPSFDCRVLRTFIAARDATGSRAVNGSLQAYLEFASYLSDADLAIAENTLRERYGAV
jgi:hypothetical protein